MATPARSVTRHALFAVPWILFGLLLIGMDVTVCPLAGIFGIPCPSCGLTRATLSILVGDWSKANQTHPGVWLVLPYLAVVALRRPRIGRILGWIGLAVLALLVVLWLLRFGGGWGGPVPVRPWRW